jgi:hypothetical protein
MMAGVSWITEFPLHPNKVLYEGMRRNSREEWFAYLDNEAYPKYKRIHFLRHTEQSVFIIKTILLTLLKGMVGVYFENLTKHVG